MSAVTSGYHYYRPIGAIVNTVSWIDLTSSSLDFTKVNANGSDLRVYDVDGDALLPYWLMDFDAAAQAGRIYFKAANTSHSHRLYYGNSGASSASSFSGTFTHGSGFDADFGDMATVVGGAGTATRYAGPSNASDSRNYMFWRIGDTPVLSYADLTAQGVVDGSYTGVREVHLVQDDSNRVLKAGTKYYAFFARRSPVTGDKIDGWRGESTSKTGPFSNFVSSYSPPSTIRLGYPGCTMKIGATYYQWLSYGWDTGGAQTPGLSIYHRTSSDLTTWGAITQSMLPSIWTDGGLAVTDCGNPWVTKCLDGNYWLVVEGQRTALNTGWKCYGATASSPAGPWTASNGGLPILTSPGSGWDGTGAGVANPKTIQMPGGTYVVEYNGSDVNSTSISDWQLGFASSNSRDGAFTRNAANPVAGKAAGTYGIETSHLSWDEDGSAIFHYCQRFETTSATAKAWQLLQETKQGGLLLSRDSAADAAYSGFSLASGTFSAESRSVLTAHRPDNATPILIGIMDSSGIQTAASAATLLPSRRIEIFRWSHDFDPGATAGRGDVTFSYWDGVGTRYFWNGSAWTTSTTGRNIAADHGREVVAKISDDGVNFVLACYYADDGSSIASASIAKTSVASFASGRLLFVGDPLTDSWGCGLFLRYIHVRPFASSDPTISIGAETPAAALYYHQRKLAGGLIAMGCGL